MMHEEMKSTAPEGGLLEYSLGEGVRAFTSGRDAVLPCAVITPHQTHSTKVALVDRADITPAELDGVDALVTSLPGLAIGVRTADCIPVLLFDPVRRAVGAVHSGWRGTVEMIAVRTVHAMRAHFGTCPEDLRAEICPGISADSFQVGAEVALAFKQAGFPPEKVWSFRGPKTVDSPAGGHHIDLKECIRHSLEGCGVLSENIHVCCEDTFTDTRFFSARREGISCGRNINAIMLI